MTTSPSIAELEQQLADARAAAAAEREARLAETPIIREFTILPVVPGRMSSDELYDDNCCFYHLQCHVVNRDEARDAGHPDHSLREGGMRYVWNNLSKRIVCSVGGGDIYISGGFSHDNDDSARQAMNEVSLFLASNPEGGDITDIVMAHRTRCGFKA